MSERKVSAVADDRTWSVFTKPWREVSPDQLGALVARMGFNAIEFPLRPGYQVDLDDMSASLGRLIKTLAQHGISVASVATTIDESTMAACAENGVSLLRTMVPFSPDGPQASRDVFLRQMSTLVPLALKHGVHIGVQPHYDYYVSDSSELAGLLDEVDSEAVVGIWDAAHDGLAYKHPRNTLPLLWDRLALINFKNARFAQSTSRTKGAADWEIVFVEGTEGLCAWPEAADYLRNHAYTGPICLPAEYTDESDIEVKAAADLAYLKALLADDLASLGELS